MIGMMSPRAGPAHGGIVLMHLKKELRHASLCERVLRSFMWSLPTLLYAVASLCGRFPSISGRFPSIGGRFPSIGGRFPSIGGRLSLNSEHAGRRAREHALQK